MINQPQPQKTEPGIRPKVVLALIGTLTAVVLPIYIFTRPLPPPKVPSPPADSVAAQPAIKGPAVVPVSPKAAKTVAKSHYISPAVRRHMPKPTNAPPPSLETQWGIQVCAVRLTMGDSTIDVRYKVLDPAKVLGLADGKTAGYLLEPTSGATLSMPKPPKEGSFPPTGNRLTAGKTYFAVIPNRSAALRRGEQVSIVLGNARTDNVTIE